MPPLAAACCLAPPRQGPTCVHTAACCAMIDGACPLKPSKEGARCALEKTDDQEQHRAEAGWELWYAMPMLPRPISPLHPSVFPSSVRAGHRTHSTNACVCLVLIAGRPIQLG